MDFKSRPPNRTSMDGFVSRPKPTANVNSPVNNTAYTPLQRRSTVGFSDVSKGHAPRSKKGAELKQAQQNPALFSNYYSSYSGDKVPDVPDGNKPPKEKKKRARWKKVVLRSSLVIVVVVVIMGGWLGWKIVGSLDKVFHGNIFSDASAIFSSNTVLKGQSSGRVNILVAGDSSDRVDPGSNGGELTDSIMILSIDTKNNTAFMLSIPRDLWVNVPGEGWAKINSTYENDGMAGMEKLISQDFGIPIDYYALTNYQAFEDLVTAVGGISVDIQSPDPRGLYDPQPYPGSKSFKLANGWQSLNGLQALDLARARGDGYGSYGFPQSDFNRTQHQRQMVVALAQKAQSLGVVSNPVRIGQIFSSLSANVQTDLKLNDAIALARLMKVVKVSNIQSEAFTYGGTNPMLTAYMASNGQSALSPTAGVGNYTQLKAFYNKLTSNNPITQEGASVAVLNGSQLVGLSHKEATTLENDGFNVTNVTDASAEYPGTMIIDLSNGKDPAARAALEQIFSTDTVTTTSTTTPAEATEAKGINANFIVVLGENWDSTSTGQ